MQTHLGKRRWHIVYSDDAKRIAVGEGKSAKLGFADADRVFKHCCEDRLQIAGRA